MKMIRIVGLILGAVFVLSAMLASTASAEITLLAEWLIKGLAVPTGTEPATETSGELTLTDTKAPIVGEATILCSFIFDGTITNENGLGWILKILTLAGIEILELEGTGILCSAVTGCEAASELSPIEVWPLNLPWHLEVILKEASVGVEQMFLVIVLAAAYHVLCLVFGVNTNDECSVENGSVLVENDAVNIGVLVNENETVSPAGTCSLGGAGSGMQTVDKDTVTLLVLSATEGALTVSSEGE